MLLEISHVSKSYPGLPVLHDLSLTADEGEIVCLLGPSGCGKSTLLRIVAGLETPDAGQVAFDGQDLAGVPPHRRHFGLMFQDYALFPHKDVAGNVAFGLRMARLPASEISARVAEMLALVGLSGYEQRRVTELSGGEQQRVALARSLAPGPRLLMFDEPLGALDRALREQLMNDLRAILKQVCVTALYVTHDQEEAFAIGDRVAIMRARPDLGEGGRIEQIGTPQEVYRQPANAYVARFLGFLNLIDGTVAAGEWENGRRRGSGSSHSPVPPLSHPHSPTHDRDAARHADRDRRHGQPRGRRPRHGADPARGGGAAAARHARYAGRNRPEHRPGEAARPLVPRQHHADPRRVRWRRGPDARSVRNRRDEPERRCRGAAARSRGHQSLGPMIGRGVHGERRTKSGFTSFTQA